MNKVAIFLCACLAFGFTVNADPDELALLQEILQQTRGSWEADNTSFSELSSFEQEQMISLLPGISDMEALPEETITDELVRDTEFQLQCPPVRNQGNCGSCYSFAASACYELRALANGQRVDLAEQDFMMKAKRIGPSGGCSG